jgi:hypothetical protein
MFWAIWQDAFPDLRTGSLIQELLSLADNWGETMAEHPNAARIRDAYAAFAKGDFAVLEDFFAEDLLWYEGGRTQLAGEHRERRPCSETPA